MIDVGTIKIAHEHAATWGDFAILTLKHVVQFSPEIQPICLLAKTNQYFNGKTAKIVGFGYNRTIKNFISELYVQHGKDFHHQGLLKERFMIDKYVDLLTAKQTEEKYGHKK